MVGVSFAPHPSTNFGGRGGSVKMGAFIRKVLLLTAVLSLICIFQNGKAYAISNPSKKVKVKKPEVSASSSNKRSTSTKPIKVASRGSGAFMGSADISSVLSYAKKYTGTRYVYGASGPNGFDCSGFTMHVMGNFGIKLPHTARGQSAYGIAVPKNNLKPGDLVFFATSGNSSISHVGIYIGGGSFIHAATSSGITVSRLSESYYSRRYVTARRIIG